MDSLFLLFSQVWRILIWQTDLEWKLIHKHVRMYASIIVMEFILAEFILVEFILAEFILAEFILVVFSCIRQI